MSDGPPGRRASLQGQMIFGGRYQKRKSPLETIFPAEKGYLPKCCDGRRMARRKCYVSQSVTEKARRRSRALCSPPARAFLLPLPQNVVHDCRCATKYCVDGNPKHGKRANLVRVGSEDRRPGNPASVFSCPTSGNAIKINELDLIARSVTASTRPGNPAPGFLRPPFQ